MAEGSPANRRAELRELRGRGLTFTYRQWASFTQPQRQDILRQSRRAATRTRRAGLPAAQRLRNARRRARRYAAKPADDRFDQWPEDEETVFWNEYIQAMK